jgi:hypothetical protein
LKPPTVGEALLVVPTRRDLLPPFGRPIKHDGARLVLSDRPNAGRGGLWNARST